MIDDIPLYLEVLTALAIGEYKDDTPLTEDPFRLALMTVNAAVRRLQNPDYKIGRTMKENKANIAEFKLKRVKKIKLITKVLKRTLSKLKEIK